VFVDGYGGVCGVFCGFVSGGVVWVSVCVYDEFDAEALAGDLV